MAQASFTWTRRALALLAAAAVIASIAYVALFGNRRPAVAQPAQLCKESVCGEYALLDCNAAAGGSLYVYTQPDRQFLADCDTSNAAQFTSQPLCSKIFETMKSCPSNTRQ